MDTLLIAATGLSLAMALGMATIVLKLLREERRRSDARVATLIAMAADDSLAPDVARDTSQVARDTSPVARGTSHVARDPSHVARDPSHVARGTSHVARDPSHVARGTSHVARDPSHVARDPSHVARGTSHVARDPSHVARDSSPVARGTLHVARDPHLAPDLFAEPERPSPWRARLAVAAALAAVVSGAGYLALSGSRSVPASGRVAGGAAAGAAAPLELLSLRHEEEAGGLAVSGLVQNPRAGAPRTRVIATALAFGADGGFLASGRAPLDFTTLAPGTESPFVVHIPVTGAVARYRIGFRAEGGDVIAHVDKRAGPGAVARK